ncbi:hypothetical protein KY361_02035 [Candidatus Woesearchaeota archaeon]|nr:hypothetical protein [Candidatus Woesearchaeota archaeon]
MPPKGYNFKEVVVLYQRFKKKYEGATDEEIRRDLRTMDRATPLETIAQWHEELSSADEFWRAAEGRRLLEPDKRKDAILVAALQKYYLDHLTEE